MQSPASDSSERSRSGAAILVRLGWMIGATLTMLIAGFSIASTPTWTFGPRDAVFWSGAVLGVAFRYWDVRRYEGQTASGERATMADVTRYAMRVSLAAFAGWLVAQSVHL